MGTALNRLKLRKSAKQAVKILTENREQTLIIHYSCESFYDGSKGQSPRITSIAVRNFGTGSTHSFSIHQVAEIQHIPFDQIAEHYNQLEKFMLGEFFAFMNNHQIFRWVHWNMRDANYGFASIEHRYRVLDGKPTIIPDQSKFDLARILVDLYGVGYASHPRLESIIRKNNISDRDFLKGSEEAKAFDNKEYVRLHQSTLRKVDCLANLLGRTADQTLKTDSRWTEVYGLSFAALGEIIREHPTYSILTVLLVFLGVIYKGMQIYNFLASKGH